MKRKRAKVLRLRWLAALVLASGTQFVLWRLLVPSYPPVDYSQQFFDHSRFFADAPTQGGDGYLAVQALIVRVREHAEQVDRTMRSDWRKLGFIEKPMAPFRWYLLLKTSEGGDEIDRRLATLAHEELQKLQAEGFFDDLASALALNDFTPPLHGSPLFNATMQNELVRYRTLARLEIARLRQALENENQENAARIASELVELATVAGSEPMALQMVIGMSIVFMLLDEIQTQETSDQRPLAARRSSLE